jgi:hypothetical protein
MSTNLISLADQLKHFPDQWLAREMQSPSGTIPPYLVLGELQRRKLLRSGQGPGGPQGTVAQETVADTLKQIAPPAPQGPPPPPGMAPAARNQPMPGSTPPQNMQTPPTRTMADGGEVDDDEDSDGGLGWYASPPPTLPKPRRLKPADYLPMADQIADQEGVPRPMMRTVLSLENGPMNPRAVSNKGATGLMQIMPETGKRFGATDLTDPEQNMRTGAKYLSFLMNKYGGDPALTLAGYNAGEGAVAKYHGVPHYPETQNYVATGLQRMQNIGSGAAYLPATAPDADADTGATSDTGPAPPTIGEASRTAQQGQDDLDNTPTQALGAVLQTPKSVQFAQQQVDEARKQLAQSQNWQAAPVPGMDYFLQEARGVLPKQDYSEEQAAIRQQQAEAQANMHPSLRNIFMQMGLGLLASRSPYFGVALGEAGLGTMSAAEQQQEKARQDYLTAIKAGMDVRTRQNQYEEKVGELAFNQKKLAEASSLQEKKEHEQNVLASNKDVTAAQKDLIGAQEKYENLQTPKTLEQMMWYGTPEQQKWATDLYKFRYGKVPKVPTQSATLAQQDASVRKWAADNNFPLTEGTGKPLLYQVPGDKLGSYQASLPKSEDEKTKEALKEAENLQKSRVEHNKWLDAHSKIADGQLDKLDNALGNLRAGGGPGDAIALLESIPATAGGPGSGVRLTKNETDTLLGGRSAWETLKAKWLHATTGEQFPAGQRQQLINALERMKEKVQTKTAILNNARERLASSTDWQKGHWQIRNQAQEEMSNLSQHAMALRDRKGTMRYFDNVSNLPRPQREGDLLPEEYSDHFLNAAGKDPYMAQRLAQHFGWSIPTE